MTSLKKKRQKRWGKQFVDKRNWPVYNEQLVKRGEYFLDLSFVESWHEELAKMNASKRGAPYLFPESLIELQAIWHAKGDDYRMIEGMTRDLCKMGQLPAHNNYTTVNRRVNKLAMSLSPPQGDSTVIFSDGSGVQAVNGGEYLRFKYGKKNRRWVQIVLLGDKEHNEPVSYEINILPGSESESTERQLVDLLQGGAPIEAVGGDGGLDNMNLWNFCDDQELTPIIKPDKNARTDTDNGLRNRVVEERNSKGYDRWAKDCGYGERWPATEGIFSAIKRMFGEHIIATSEKGMEKEAAAKVWAYQRMKRYGEA